MPEEKIDSLMRDFVKTLEKGDVEKTLSFLTEDAAWVTPEGTFKGKEELRRYLTWSIQSMSDLKVTDTGIGIMVQANKAFYEHVLEGSIQGMKCKYLAMCATSSAMAKSSVSGQFTTGCRSLNRRPRDGSQKGQWAPL